MHAGARRALLGQKGDSLRQSDSTDGSADTRKRGDEQGALGDGGGERQGAGSEGTGPVVNG